MNMRSNTMRKPTLVAKSTLLVTKLKKKRKRKRKKETSSSENSFRELLDEAKDKIKDTSLGENLLEAPEEAEIEFPFRSLPPEKSSILNEDTIPVNLGMINNPQITYIAATLSPKEQKVIIEFLKKGKINFTWTYKDMPGLDTDLVVHHLAVDPKIKLVKQKLHS